MGCSVVRTSRETVGIQGAIEDKSSWCGVTLDAEIFFDT